jgi:hypothetical protein
MSLRSLAVVVAFALCAVPALGDDGLSYNDPGMHFSPPPGWVRVDLSAAQGSDNAPVAVYTYHQGQSDALSITITIVDSTDSLDVFEGSHEQALRKQSDSEFIYKRKPMQLSNGMPVYFLQSQWSSQSGGFYARFEYIVIDGQRGITVSYVGSANDTNEKGALAAMSSLYVVAYPGHAPS